MVVNVVGRYLGILMSPVADCNLEEYLRGPLTDNKRSLLSTSFGCLVAALKYLHQISIRHKDIKPQVSITLD
jgi:serine/threonine protein kinase